MIAPQVAIIDYGLCNLDSIRRAIEISGAKPFVTCEPDSLSSANYIVLPGVGAFGVAMENLQDVGMDDAIRTQVKAGIPLLGICLGMQLLALESSEGGTFSGLAIIPGHVVLLESERPEDRVPHIGWNSVTIDRPDDPLFDSLASETNFYFVHSYHIRPADSNDAIGTTPHCGRFVSVVRHENVVGTQFHPEKSQRAGLRLLKNFLSQ